MPDLAAPLSGLPHVRRPPPWPKREHVQRWALVARPRTWGISGGAAKNRIVWSRPENRVRPELGESTIWCSVIGLSPQCSLALGGPPPAAIAISSPHSSGPLGDTWFSINQTRREPAGAHPSPRYAAALAYDAVRKDFVLFGGQAGAVSYGETWSFDGQTWKRENPQNRCGW